MNATLKLALERMAALEFKLVECENPKLFYHGTRWLPCEVPPAPYCAVPTERPCCEELRDDHQGQ